MKRLANIGLAAAAAASMLVLSGPAVTSAAPPSVVQDEGAFVRLVGNPADGTAKFQYGWASGTPASDGVGYWIGVYDVTNSHYEWVIAEEDIDLPSSWSKNAKPTAYLPNGMYKVVFFVRGSYEPDTTNISEIELFFTVSNSPY